MNNTEHYRILFDPNNIIAVHDGNQSRLIFYDKPRSLSKHAVQSLLDIDVKLLDDGYHIAIDKQWFDHAVRHNDDVLAEIEHMLAYNKGHHAWITIGMFFLSYGLYLSLVATITVAMMSQGASFFLQMTMLVCMVGGILLASGYLYLRHLKTDQILMPKARMLLHYLKNKEYREQRAQFLNEQSKESGWWSKLGRIHIGKPFHNAGRRVLILGILYVFVLISFGVYFFIVTGLSPALIVRFGAEVVQQSDAIPSFVKTKYVLERRIEGTTPEIQDELCGTSSCIHTDGNLVFQPTVDDLDWLFTNSEQLRRIYSSSINWALVQIKDTETDTYRTLLVNHRDQTVVHELNDTFYGDDGTYLIGDSRINDDLLYISGIVAFDENDGNGFVMAIDDQGIVASFETDGPAFIHSMVIENDIVHSLEWTGTVHPYSTTYRQYDIDLNVLDNVTYENRKLYDLHTIDGLILTHLIDDDMYTTDIMKIDPDGALKIVLEDALSLDLWFFPDRLTTYANLISYREYDSDYNIINRGILCDECTDNELFDRTVEIIPYSHQLIAIYDDHALVFAESDTYHYALSRIQIPLADYLQATAVLVFGFGISILILRNKEKHIRSVRNALVIPPMAPGKE